MQPFERLRYLARWSDDDEALVHEATDCLAAFASDPAGLVVACRRLLAHHPASAPLWWLCARVLTAADPADAAWHAWQVLSADPTAERLAGQLPFPHDEPVAVYGWPPTIAAAIADRPDLDVVAVRPRGSTRAERSRFAPPAPRVVGESEILALGPTHLLAEPDALGDGHALVRDGTTDLATALRDHGAVVWLVAGTGRVLPERLFDAVVRAVGIGGGVELLDLAVADRVAGPQGLEAPSTAARRAGCPVAPELLRLGG